MTSEVSYARLQVEIERQTQARLADLRNQGKTLYRVYISKDDTSTGRPELWCIMTADGDEVVQDHLTDADWAAFIADHPDWVDVAQVEEEIRDTVSESWESGD